MDNFGRNKVQPIRSKKDLENCFVYLQRKVDSIDPVKSPSQYKISLRNYFLIYLGVNVGLRIQDLLTLNVAMIKKGFIQLREKKTGKIQQIPIHLEVQRTILTGYINKLNLDDSSYLFTSRKGYNEPITRQAAYDVVKTVGKELGWKFPIGTHTLRKTFGYQYYKQTNNIVGLQRMFNHRDPQVTLIYIGMIQKEVDDERMNFKAY